MKKIIHITHTQHHIIDWLCPYPKSYLIMLGMPFLAMALMFILIRGFSLPNDWPLILIVQIIFISINFLQEKLRSNIILEKTVINDYS